MNKETISTTPSRDDAKEVARIASWIANSFYTQQEFAPLNTVSGLLSQIDNMVVGIYERTVAASRDNEEVAREIASPASYGYPGEIMPTELYNRISQAIAAALAANRNALVDVVKAKRDEWLARLPNSDDPTFKYHYQTRADAATEIITALGSEGVGEGNG